MRRVLAVGFLVSVLATAAIAQSDSIAQRKALMDKVGDQTKIGAAILKGQEAYDPAKATAIFKAFADASKFGTLFPAGSDKGDTKAAPAIWSDRAGFDAELDHKLARKARSRAHPMSRYGMMKESAPTPGIEPCSPLKERLALGACPCCMTPIV